MVPSCRRAMLALWTITSFYPYLAHCLTLTVTTKQLFPGGSIQVESTTTASDPALANLYIYDTRHEVKTELWTEWPAKNSPHSIFTIPSNVVPGPGFVVQATDTSGKFLANSDQFVIVPAGSASSVSGSTSSTQTSGMSSFLPTSSAPASTTATSSSSTTSAAPSASSSAAPAASMPIGAIIGGVLGGLAVIAVILALILLLRRRRPAKPTAFPVDKAPAPDVFPAQDNSRRNPTISPFTLTSPPVLNQIPVDVKHPVPPTTPTASVSSPSGKKGLYSPTPMAPGSATTSSGFSSSSDNLSKRRMMELSSGCSEPSVDVRRELEELKSQVEMLRLQNQAAGINPDAPPVYR